VLALLVPVVIILLLAIPNVILATTFGSFLSAVTAYFMGDKTAYNDGFVTLNPTKHIDVLGYTLFLGIMLLTNTLLGHLGITPLVLLFLIMAGIRRPIDVPFNEENFNNPISGQVLTLLAKPVGLLTYSFLSLLIMKFIPINTGLINSIGTWQFFVWQFLDYGATIGIFFGILELLPLPMQTSGRIIEVLSPPEFEEILESYSLYASIIFLGLFIIPGVREVFFSSMTSMTYGIKTIFHKIIF
jgi:Zn-dependent protease